MRCVSSPVPRAETATQSAPSVCNETGIRRPFTRPIVTSAPALHSVRSRARRSNRAMRSRSDSASKHRSFRLPLRGQLAFEVFEQSVPVHPTERRRPRTGAYELSTFFASPHSRRWRHGAVLLTRRPPRPRVRHDAARVLRTPADIDQRASRPRAALRSLTHGVLEVLAGVREVDQLARWFSEDAFRSLVTRANLSSRARSARGVAPARPTFEIRALRSRSRSTA